MYDMQLVILVYHMHVLYSHLHHKHLLTIQEHNDIGDFVCKWLHFHMVDHILL